MINNKKLNIITLGLMLIAVSVCFVLGFMTNTNKGGITSEYEKKMFAENIINIDIQVDEEDWQKLLDNALTKEYISGNLLINGDKFSAVGIRTKGNSSLSQVVMLEDSDRYSLQFTANKFIKGQTFYGLDSFCINNIIGDTTYMKDYLSYDLMNYIGVDTPLKNYANVTVNGKDFGFFLALERYSKSFLARLYNTSAGQLYNVKMAMGPRDDFMPSGGMPPFNNWQMEGFNPRDNRESGLEINNGEGFPPNNFPSREIPFMEQEERSPMFPNRREEGFGGREEGFPMFPNRMEEGFGGREEGFPMFPNGMEEGFGGMGGFAGMGERGGGSLIYTDDNIASYSSIFDNAVFNKNSDKDKEKVIKAIKNLNLGNDLEKYIDIDKTLRYLAAHTVLVNLDSYSSNMAQNYYLYERNGKLTILPWDYNYSFGGFQSGSSSDVINFPIDSPVSGVDMEARPLINMLLAVEDYKEKYHEYLQEIVDGYFQSGLFEETINSLASKINSYVKNDSSSFTSYEKYEASLPALIKIGNLRAESISGQLNGNIPSSREGQMANKSLLLDGSGIDLSSLGNMMGGFRGPRGNEERPGIEGNETWDPNNRRPGQGMMPDDQAFAFGREPFPHNGEDFFRQRNGLPNARLSSSLANKGVIKTLIASIVLLLLAFGYILKAKKNY